MGCFTTHNRGELQQHQCNFASLRWKNFSPGYPTGLLLMSSLTHNKAWICCKSEVVLNQLALCVSI